MVGRPAALGRIGDEPGLAGVPCVPELRADLVDGFLGRGTSAGSRPQVRQLLEDLVDQLLRGTPGSELPARRDRQGEGLNITDLEMPRPGWSPSGLVSASVK
ncbi:hypothetical protein GCM10010393_15520 [Streptomyces gobitricini]|uniref:Uncharacterized protein n=1 Tax=Streptomyces gobitricini TaxID=68211 RepID=A0ABN3LKD5_9ACTN